MEKREPVEYRAKNESYFGEFVLSSQHRYVNVMRIQKSRLHTKHTV